MTIKKITSGLLVSAMLVSVAACSGSSSSVSGTSNSSEAVTVSSLSEIPQLSTMLTNSSASASINRFAVSGTPTALTQIDEASADTLFWNGLIADINTNGADSEDMDPFWLGEGKCRVAQMVGYSFQNIDRSGTSLCYMKNAPSASSGVTAESGISQEDLPNVMSQSTETKIIKIQVSGTEVFDDGEGDESESGNEDIFIRVYGTNTTEGSAGYAADLWFCQEGQDTSTGYEQIRVNTDEGTITSHNVETDWGVFIMDFNGNLLEDEDGNVSFDPDEAQTAQYYYVYDDGEFSGTHKGLVGVESGTLTAKEIDAWTFDSQTENRNSYGVSNFTGTSTSDFAILGAGFATEWTRGEESDSFSGAMEFQDTTYVQVETGEFFDAVSGFSFNDDTFYQDDLTLSEDEYDTADYGCGETADIVISMDMSDAAFQEEIISQCETPFEDMQFCDSDSIYQARETIFSEGFFGGEGEGEGEGE